MSITKGKCFRNAKKKDRMSMSSGLAFRVNSKPLWNEERSGRGDITILSERNSDCTGGASLDPPRAGRRSKDREVDFPITVIVCRLRIVARRPERDDLLVPRHDGTTEDVPAAVAGPEDGDICLAIAIIIGRNRFVGTRSPKHLDVG